MLQSGLIYVNDYTLICTVCEAILYSSNIYCNQTAGNTKGRDWAVIKPRTPGGWMRIDCVRSWDQIAARALSYTAIRAYHINIQPSRRVH